MPDRYLRTKITSATFWSFYDTVGHQFLQLGLSIVLARYLLPEHFGLLGMLAVFMGIAAILIDGGFSHALIQQKEIRDEDASTVFFFNCGLGAFLLGCIALIANPVSDFFSEPDLAPLAQLLGISFLFYPLSAAQQVQLIRKLDFQSLAKANLASLAIGGSVGVGLAIQGYGAWSLVIQQLVTASTRAGLLWLLSSWRPTLFFELAVLQHLYRYGSQMMLAGLLNSICSNLYLVAIGKAYTTAELGIYTRARQLQQVPSHSISNMVSRVMFPVFSSLQHDPVRLKNAMKRALTTLMMVNAPIMIGLAVVAEPLIACLFPEEWLPVVPFLRLMVILGLLYPLHLINLNLLQGLGRSDLFLKLEIIKQLLTLLNISLTWRINVETMIFGQILLSLFAFYLNSRYARSLVNYPSIEQIRDLLPYVGSACAMGGLIWVLGMFTSESELVSLLTQTVVGIAIYTAICRALRLSAFNELLAIAREQFTLKPR